MQIRYAEIIGAGPGLALELTICAPAISRAIEMFDKSSCEVRQRHAACWLGDGSLLPWSYLDLSLTNDKRWMTCTSRYCIYVNQKLGSKLSTALNAKFHCGNDVFNVDYNARIYMYVRTTITSFPQ